MPERPPVVLLPPREEPKPAALVLPRVEAPAVPAPPEVHPIGFWEDAGAIQQAAQQAASRKAASDTGPRPDPDVTAPRPNSEYAQRMQTTRFADTAPTPPRFHVHYTIKKGTVFPCTPASPISSSLPGPVQCTVDQDVWSMDGTTILLPRGTQVNGTIGVRFDPDDPATWGKGGAAPLLIDPCTSDATHGAVFAGSGGYKTTAVTIPTLAHWTGSAVVLDPSGQVGPMTAAMRETMGHKVAMIGPGLDGFNVLDWIDPADPLAETHVQAIIDRVAGETPTGQDQNAIFKVRGKELLTCLLADLLWSDAPAEQKTLREFRRWVRTPEKKMKGLLGDIQTGSKSPLARDLAGSLVDVFTDRRCPAAVGRNHTRGHGQASGRSGSGRRSQ